MPDCYFDHCVCVFCLILFIKFKLISNKEDFCLFFCPFAFPGIFKSFNSPTSSKYLSISLFNLLEHLKHFEVLVSSTHNFAAHSCFFYHNDFGFSAFLTLNVN